MPLMLLIRHGENDYTKYHKLAGRLPGIHLNEQGREQARRLCAALKNVRIKSVYTSPLERAVETAAQLAEEHGIEIQENPGLIETNVGRWQGRTQARLRLTRAWQNVQFTPSQFRFPEGESFLECQVRIVTTLETIRMRHKKEDIIACVFHADPIKLAVAHYLGMPLDNFQKLGCDTGSVTIFRITDSTSKLISTNLNPDSDIHNRLANVGRS